VLIVIIMAVLITFIILTPIIAIIIIMILMMMMIIIIIIMMCGRPGRQPVRDVGGLLLQQRRRLPHQPPRGKDRRYEPLNDRY
jgi:hypothetical protein